MESTTYSIKPETSKERIEFYEKLDKSCTAPLWEVRVYKPTPQPAIVPKLWRYEEIRALLMEAGNVITPKEAVRRVLVLENPGIRGKGFSQITQSLFAGLQLVLPGEVAPCHRHTASAFRLVLEGEGAYTAVDGERAIMHRGDFVLTPSWMFHDHGNPTSEPVIWLDGLDLPIADLFDSSFREFYPGGVHPVTRSDGDALARYGANMLPLEYRPPNLFAPVFSYPYARSREALEEVSRNEPLHACHGHKMQYSNPASGGYPLPTIAVFLQLLPGGFRGLPYRSTDSTVYCILEGRGSTQVGNVTFTWGRHDIFVVPSWHPVSHESEDQAVMFSFSDRGAQKALGFWREEAPLRGV